MQWKWNACCNVVSVGHRGVQDAAVTYIADTPGNSAFLASSRGLVCLALDAYIVGHQSVTGPSLNVGAEGAEAREGTHRDP